MPHIQINVQVPFEGCIFCKKFKLEQESMYDHDGIFATNYFCEHYSTCENASKMAGKRGEE